MNKADEYFKDNLWTLKERGYWDENPRAKYKDGTPAKSKFITHVFESYNIDGGEFPLNSFRNTAIKGGIQEIFWIYQDMSNSLNDLHKRKVFWWDDFNVGDGTIGNRYGYTVHKYDLMNRLLKGLVENPFGRRHFIELLQEDDLGGPGLFPCAHLTEWSVRKVDGKMFLDLFLGQRSSDYITASSINKIQYVALLMMVARHCGFFSGKFSHFTNNLHVYDRHIPALHELLSRNPLDTPPSIKLREGANNFWEMSIDDFEIINPMQNRQLINKIELAI